MSKWLQQSRKRIALALRIGIDENDDAVTRSSEAALQCSRFSMVFLSQQADAPIALGNALDLFSGPVVRTVVHDNDFDVAFVIGRQKRAQSFRNQFAFIISSDHHADRFRKIRSGRASET